MTYNVFGGTLSLTQSINQPLTMGQRHDDCVVFVQTFTSTITRWNASRWRRSSTISTSPFCCRRSAALPAPARRLKATTEGLKDEARPPSSEASWPTPAPRSRRWTKAAMTVCVKAVCSFCCWCSEPSGSVFRSTTSRKRQFIIIIILLFICHKTHIIILLLSVTTHN